MSALLDHAADIRSGVESGKKDYSSTFKDKRIGLMFFEPSTRTRLSFEMACLRLGITPMLLSKATSSAVKGETLLDTARTLEQIGVDGIVLRHQDDGAPSHLAQHLRIPVINGGDGQREHPTQALLDMLTIRDEFGTLEGVTVAIIGDVAHSRVAKSNCIGLRAMGAQVFLCGPEEWCPPSLASICDGVEHDIDRVLAKADVLMALRIQKERIQGSLPTGEGGYSEAYGLTASRMKGAKPEAIVMHPAPMNRGVEISDDIADGPRSRIFRQMSNGVFVRMAVLHHVLSEDA